MRESGAMSRSLPGEAAHVDGAACWTRSAQGGPTPQASAGSGRNRLEAGRWSEFDTRRPLTPTGTNLLGLVKHLAVGQASYFGLVFDRPFPDPLPWWEDGAEPNGDMYATAEEPRDWVLEFYRRACDHADATITALDLDVFGEVPWWEPDPRVTLHQILVHTVSEGHRHLGHADILREQLDGSAGVRPEHSNLPEARPGLAGPPTTISFSRSPTACVELFGQDRSRSEPITCSANRERLELGWRQQGPPAEASRDRGLDRGRRRQTPARMPTLRRRSRTTAR